ncbi:hypothetical protein CEXT_477261, partial [Caerostris extrusa]
SVKFVIALGVYLTFTSSNSLLYTRLPSPQIYTSWFLILHGKQGRSTLHGKPYTVA